MRRNGDVQVINSVLLIIRKRNDIGDRQRDESGEQCQVDQIRYVGTVLKQIHTDRKDHEHRAHGHVDKDTASEQINTHTHTHTEETSQAHSHSHI